MNNLRECPLGLCQFFASLAAAAVDDLATFGGLHSVAEAACGLSLFFAGLIGALHGVPRGFFSKNLRTESNASKDILQELVDRSAGRMKLIQFHAPWIGAIPAVFRLVGI
jgi:hypothetical protein